MATQEENILQTTVTLKDNFSSNARKIGESSQKMSDNVKKSGNAFEALDEKVSRTSRLLSKLPFSKSVKFKAVDINRVTREVNALEKEITAITGNRINVTATAKINKSDIRKAKREAKELEKQLQDMTGRKYKVNMEGLGGGGGFMSSLKGMAAGGMASMGAGLLAGGTAALGAAAVGGVGKMYSLGAAREQNMVSLTHFLGGDQEAAQGMMDWASEDARKTQYSEGEIQATARRAVQITDGDVSKAKELTKMAEDMASLTPGKTVDQAIEALADAQMGEMERMKEFGFKAGKEEFDAAGGDLTKLKSQTNGKTIAEMFEGGTAAGGGTSSAKMGTIMGTFETSLANVGEKMNKALAPALDFLVGKAEEWAPKLEEGLTAFGGGLMSLFEALQPFTPLLSAIGSIVGGALKLAFETVGSVLNKLVIPGIKYIGEKVNPVFSSLKEHASSVAKKFGSLKTKIDGFIDAIGNFPTWIKNKIDSFHPFSGGGGGGGGGSRKGGGKKGGKSSKKSATGAEAFNGGITQMNENSQGEIVKLPNGSKIYPFQTTVKMLKKKLDEVKDDKDNNKYNFNINIDARGSNLKESDEKRIEKRVVKAILDALHNVPDPA